MQSKVIDVFKKFQMKKWKIIDANDTEGNVFKKIVAAIDFSLVHDKTNDDIHNQTISTLW